MADQREDFYAEHNLVDLAGNAAGLIKQAQVEKLTTASNVEIKACKNQKCVNLARAYNKLALAYADLASGRKS